MNRCEPDIDTCTLYPKAQKHTIIYHIAIPSLVDFVFLEKSDVSFKHTQFHTGSVNPLISLSANYGLFQESQVKSHSLGWEGTQSLWNWPRERFFNRILGPTS